MKTINLLKKVKKFFIYNDSAVDYAAELYKPEIQKISGDLLIDFLSGQYSPEVFELVKKIKKKKNRENIITDDGIYFEIEKKELPEGVYYTVEGYKKEKLQKIEIDGLLYVVDGEEIKVYNEEGEIDKIDIEDFYDYITNKYGWRKIKNNIDDVILEGERETKKIKKEKRVNNKRVNNDILTLLKNEYEKLMEGKKYIDELEYNKMRIAINLSKKIYRTEQGNKRLGINSIKEAKEYIEYLYNVYK